MRNSCYTYLTLKGDFVPANITETLKIIPNTAWGKGDKRPNGSVAGSSYWCTDYVSDITPSFYEQPEKLVDSFVRHEERLATLIKENNINANIEIVPRIYSGQPMRLLLTSKVMDFCKRTGVGINIDYYTMKNSDVKIGEDNAHEDASEVTPKSNSCSTFFSVYGAFEPDYLTDILCITPHRVWAKGKPGASGKKLEFSKWTSCRCDTYDIVTSSQLKKTISALNNKEECLKHIRESFDAEYLLEVRAVVESNNCKPILSPDDRVIDFCSTNHVNMNIFIDVNI